MGYVFGSVVWQAITQEPDPHGYLAPSSADQLMKWQARCNKCGMRSVCIMSVHHVRYFPALLTKPEVVNLTAEKIHDSRSGISLETVTHSLLALVRSECCVAKRSRITIWI